MVIRFYKVKPAPEDFAYDGNGNMVSLKRYVTGTLMDDLSYGYNRNSGGKLLNNQLSRLADGVSGSANTGELTGTTDYTYDATGNLVTDSGEGITDIDWTVYGKIRKISKSDASENVSYTYDAGGNRVRRKYGGITSWYVRDAQGNLLSVYDSKSGNINWREQPLYGSSRLGIWKPNFNLANDSAGIKWNYTGLIIESLLYRLSLDLYLINI